MRMLSYLGLSQVHFYVCLGLWPLNLWIYDSCDQKKKWDVVCQSKNKGGLGIKNLDLINKSLLAKWRWRFLTCKSETWVKLLEYRYGDLSQGLSRTHLGHNMSIWWRDLCLLEEGSNVSEGWFTNAVRRRLETGQQIRFWQEVWVGTTTLKELFPRLYRCAVNKDLLVAEAGRWEDDLWRWSFRWTRVLITGFGWRMLHVNFRYGQPICYCNELRWCSPLTVLWSTYLSRSGLRRFPQRC